MKFTALNACRRHVMTLAGVVLVPLMFITSCKKDQDATPETTSIGSETLWHHRTWADTVKNNPGTVNTGSSSAGSATTTKPASGTTTPAGSTTTTGSTTTKTTTTTTPVATTPATITYKTSAAITLNNKSNVVISGLAVPSITLNNCTNVTIRNCKIGPASTYGVQTYECTGVTVDSCSFSYVVTGVYALVSKTIVVSNCRGKNMQGPFPHGQFVQFDNVTGGGNRIINNKFENILGQGNPEDAINVYESTGLATDPIIVSGNEIRGSGPGSSASGIMMGDKGGAYQIAENNTLVDPGQVGMAIAGGNNIQIVNNTIYGKQQSFTNVGLYYWNQSGQASSSITISGNKVNFTKNDGEMSNMWLPHGGATPIGWSTNIYDNTLGESLLPSVLTNL